MNASTDESARQPRRATADDVDAITALVQAAYAKYVARIGTEPLPMVADYAAVVRAHQVWLVDGADGLQAVLELIPADDHLLVENIAVAPDIQARGLGRQLMAFAASEARRQGYAELRLYTNEKMHENIAFYGRLGFVESGRSVRDGRHIVFMTQRLD